jgi:Family of unknown function (DUF6353)
MKFIPPAISRKIAAQALLAKKNSPTILFGAGIASMVGSTVLACRATLKLSEVLDEVESDMHKSQLAKEKVESGNGPEGVTYTDREMKQDQVIIYVRGVTKVVKLYAPALIFGGIGVVCLTKSHQILQERNAALTAAYIAIDTAFKKYRERVVERYGEETDRELRFDAEEVDIIDEDTGKVISAVVAVQGEPSGYARWFDEENNNWSNPAMMEYNWLFLRSQQNWANDMLRARGHLFLNEAYSMVGLPHTSAGSIVGWIYDRNNDRGDNYVDFGCWDKENRPLQFFNGREGAILLDFNVDGPIWELIDARNEEARIERES